MSTMNWTAFCTSPSVWNGCFINLLYNKLERWQLHVAISGKFTGCGKRSLVCKLVELLCALVLLYFKITYTLVISLPMSSISWIFLGQMNYLKNITYTSYFWFEELVIPTPPSFIPASTKAVVVTRSKSKHIKYKAQVLCIPTLNILHTQCICWVGSDMFICTRISSLLITLFDENG